MAVLKWVSTYWWALLLLLVALFWVLAQHDSDLLAQRAHYTIGYLTGSHYSVKNGKYFDFRFTVADSVYQGSSLSEKGMHTATGSRFVVKYDSLHPASNVGYFAQAIPDSIRQAPPNGWRKPPFHLPQ
ncbi:MAG: hypothetical protein ACRYG7_21425 [Janthinobacterium lividum]